MGISMVLNADVENYSVTNGNFYGFKVLIKLNKLFTLQKIISLFP